MEEKLSKKNIWNSLHQASKIFTNVSMRELRALSEERLKKFAVLAPGIKLDYSCQFVDTNVISLLIKLSEAINIEDKIQWLFNGSIVNFNEKKPALHTALRLPKNSKPIVIDSVNIVEDVINMRLLMQEYAQLIRSGLWLGYSGKPIENIVNIGIGGSDFGPKWSLRALDNYVSKDLSFHFISDADPDSFYRVTANLNPETTLFIIASKSFTTKETLYNMQKAKDFIGCHSKAFKHFVAVTANEDKAKSQGIEFILKIWDFIGGRFSICSAINFITMVAIGIEAFNEFLEGAYAMDLHFKTSKLMHNLPVLYALLGIWNNNFLNINNLLLLIYSNKLEYFVDYVQQLDMESNGKSIDVNGNIVDYATGPIVWGGLGNKAQHSYYQLLCQGGRRVSIDFICFANQKNTQLYESYLQHQHVLTYGKNSKNLYDNIVGNISSNTLLLEDSTPFCFGALASLYEHKIYVQSLIWNINCFDQPGVESAKRSVAVTEDELK